MEMSLAEFKRWAEGSKWHIDVCMLYNQNEYMCFQGERHGKFIIIEPNGKLLLGNYEGAYPHITDAEFHITFSKKFASQEAALTRIRASISNFPSVEIVRNSLEQGKQI